MKSLAVFFLFIPTLAIAQETVEQYAARLNLYCVQQPQYARGECQTQARALVAQAIANRNALNQQKYERQQADQQRERERQQQIDQLNRMNRRY